MNEGVVRFLPWVREGLVSGLPAANAVEDALPARAGVPLSLEVTPSAGDRTPVSGGRTARVFGPGDVTALDVSQVIRVYPSSDADGCEPNGLAAIEFDRPDLPWLFTPAGPDARGRLRPWLVLVVVPWGPDLLEPASGPGLARLTCPAAELPDLSESWAWAHAQCFVLSGESVDSVLAGAPDRTLSRLLCPRRLVADTAYLAAIVPAFEAGRRAGLGLPLESHEDGPLVDAWTPGQSAPVTLPVYHHWRFRTGAEGDFETLVRKLRPRELPDDVGMRMVDVTAAGSGLPSAGMLGFEGALRAVGGLPTPWPEALRGPWRTTLRALLDPSGTRLSPPVHGAVHAGPAGRPAQVPAEGAQPHWLRELNLDPRYRAAASLGASVIREHQEDLAAAAWEQAAALVEANAQLRTAQLARAASDVVYNKRLSGAASTALVASERAAVPEGSPQAGVLLSVTQPVHGGVAGSGGTTVANQLAASPSVQAAVSPAFRRVTRPRGPLARRLGSSEASRSRVAAAAPIGVRALIDLATTSLSVVPPAALPEGGSALEQLSADPSAPVRLRDITAQVLRDVSASTLKVRKTSGEVAAEKGAELVAMVSPGVISTPPGGSIGGNRFFVGTTDGRLFERLYVDGHGIWRDHGQPPGGAKVGYELLAIRGDLSVFVTSTDGRIFRRHIDTGHQWGWEAIPNPPGVTFASGGILINYNELLVVSSDGRLFVLQMGSVPYSWLDLGRPHVSHGAAGTPAFGGTGAQVTTATGRLFTKVRGYFGGEWMSWSDLQATQSLRPGPWMGEQGFWATTTGGQVLFYNNAIMGSGWYPTAALSPAAVSAPGGGFDGHAVVVTSDGGLAELTGSSWTKFGPPPGGLAAAARPGGYTNTPDGQRVHVRTQTGRLAALRRVGLASTWEDYGFPADSGGSGGLNDLPVADVRWAPQLGALSSLLVARLANPAPYQVQVEYRVARELGLDGQPTGGWDPTPRTAPATYEASVGIGVAAADLNGSGRPDLVVLTVSQMHWFGEQRGYAGYQIGWELGIDGSPTGGWSEVKKLPDPLPLGLGEADLALADLDGDGKLELILAYVAGSGENTRLYYRIGWGLQSDGSVAGGWSHSIEVPIQPGQVSGVGVAIADMDDDDMPDLVISLLRRDAVTGKSSMAYLIGRKLNRRGHVVGGWTPLITVGGAPLSGYSVGMGLAVADFTGTRRPDLLVFFSAGSPLRSFYRIGYDVGPDGTAWSWSADIEVAPSFPTGGPLAVTLTDLDPRLVAERARMRERFLTAATRHQTYLAPAQAKAAETPPTGIDVPAVASTLRGSLDPERTVVESTLARVPVAHNTPATGEPGADVLRPLLAGVSFPQPTYELLRRISKDALLPGVEKIPPDSITLLRANPAFIEAFLVGMNTEMSREMLWREFPADPRHTYFRQFWDVRGAVSAGAPLTDIPPIASWDGGPLGSHATGVGGAGEGNLLLVIRGELLRRYPSTRLSACRAAWDPAQPGRRILTSTEVQPIFSGWHAPDLLLFGFPLSARQARGSTTDPGWFFILRENLAAVRFGLDDPPAHSSGSAELPASWNDVHWGHVVPTEVPAGRAVHAVIGGAPVAGHTLEGVRYGYNSAHQALVVTQRPVMVALHASDMIGDLDDGWQVTHIRTLDAADPYERIRELAGVRPDGAPWRLPVAEAIAAVERGEYFYVRSTGGDAARIHVVHRANGTRHLRTGPDDEPTNNLLSLPEILP
ncbi:DUF3892 domain-containing protein [Archangium minus]|uniref:DUF3892 domain-containing protein n=1 Tax=Archangium minus TaxID=83450 RepID=A0ABY9WYF7_9BACT|nr:DUF3892 domain-containing protein [Archangium minus]